MAGPAARCRSGQAASDRRSRVVRQSRPGAFSLRGCRERSARCPRAFARVPSPGMRRVVRRARRPATNVPARRPRDRRSSAARSCRRPIAASARWCRPARRRDRRRCSMCHRVRSSPLPGQSRPQRRGGWRARARPKGSPRALRRATRTARRRHRLPATPGSHLSIDPGARARSRRLVRLDRPGGGRWVPARVQTRSRNPRRPRPRRVASRPPAPAQAEAAGRVAVLVRAGRLSAQPSPVARRAGDILSVLRPQEVASHA